MKEGNKVSADLIQREGKKKCMNERKRNYRGKKKRMNELQKQR